jgi:hypothetical protein
MTASGVGINKTAIPHNYIRKNPIENIFSHKLMAQGIGSEGRIAEIIDL